MTARLATFDYRGSSWDSVACVIGRSLSCDVRIDDRLLAPEHCEIRFEDGRFLLSDRGTVGGTVLDGQLVSGRAALDGKHVIVIGTTLLSVAVDGRRANVEIKKSQAFHMSRGTIAGRDPDRWVRDELQFAWVGSLLRSNRVTAVIAIAFMIALLAWGAMREAWLDPGPLSCSHARLMDQARSGDVPNDARLDQMTALVHEQGCGTCHEFGQGTTVANCAKCHAAMIEGQHPFLESDLAVQLPMTHRPDQAFCRRCHVDHLGARGLVTTAPAQDDRCMDCHLLAPPKMPPQPRPPVANQPTVFRPTTVVNFDHAMHLTRGMPCAVCHHMSAGSECGPTAREFAPVEFETCAHCHVESVDANDQPVPRSLDWIPADRRDAWLQQLPGWLPDGPSGGSPRAVWRVDWHGSEDPARCRACHAAAGREGAATGTLVAAAPAGSSTARAQLRGVERRVESVDSYRDGRARYAVERRSHADEFAAHTGGDPRSCATCHRRGALEPKPAPERTFWHALHQTHTDLQPGDDAARRAQVSADGCMSCHDGLRGEHRLRSADRLYVHPSAATAPDAACAPCHCRVADGARIALRLDPAPAPKVETFVRPDFPHSDHLNVTGSCFACHAFEPLANGDLPWTHVPTTLPQAFECSSCHREHDNVGAGSGCRNCHPMSDGWTQIWAGAAAITVAATPERPMRQLPPTSFDHRSRGHEELVRKDCGICHAADGLERKINEATTISEISVPTEDLAACRECHYRRRYHWR